MPDGLFAKLRDGLFKSRQNLGGMVDGAVAEHRAVDEDLYDSLLDALILSDMGTACADEAISRLRARVKAENVKDGGPLQGAAQGHTRADGRCGKDAPPLADGHPHGGGERRGQNHHHRQAGAALSGLGRTIMLCAADTFRAAAAEQLTIWRSARVCRWCAIRRARTPRAWCLTRCRPPRPARADLLIVDTAGRLHNRRT